jgi:hypothetical protein
MNRRWWRGVLAATLLLGAAPNAIGPAAPPPGEPRLLVTVGDATEWTKAPALTADRM